jgi:toxin ParE1/3/4
MRLVWSNTARNDLKQLNAYIGQDSPIYARQFIQRILTRVETLPDFPNLGRHVPEANRDDLREIVFQGYRVIYQAADDHILILTVVHGSRDLNDPGNRPWEV